MGNIGINIGSIRETLFGVDVTKEKIKCKLATMNAEEKADTDTNRLLYEAMQKILDLEELINRITI